MMQEFSNPHKVFQSYLAALLPLTHDEHEEASRLSELYTPIARKSGKCWNPLELDNLVYQRILIGRLLADQEGDILVCRHDFADTVPEVLYISMQIQDGKRIGSPRSLEVSLDTHKHVLRLIAEAVSDTRHLDATAPIIAESVRGLLREYASL